MSTKDASQRRPALIVRKEENNKNNKRRDVPLFLGKKIAGGVPLRQAMSVSRNLIN